MATLAADAGRALTAWFPDADGTGLAPLGAGHINDTWLVPGPAGRLVLQRINAAVFPDPRGIAAKVAVVTAHLQRRGVAVPRLLTTAAGQPWHEDARGVWRLSEFVAGTRTLQVLDNVVQAEAAGRAFGRFQRALSDLREPVAEPIPGFMRLSHYLAELDAVAGGATGDDRRVADAVDVIAGRRDLAAAFAASDRLIHGDCKVNNLLFHGERDEVVCVLDLDTVMPGHWAWDFGDLVRSAAADDGAVSVSRFAAVARGFLGAGATAPDVEALVLAPRYVALMLGVRFLTDHLRGDRYFKVVRRGDNLRRAVEQLTLLRDMERRETAMRTAVAAL